jgi:Cu(I)/Ag(I) efflux system membrane fusion protein
MYVRPDTEIMAIGSRDSVWVIAEFFERQAGLVAEGQAVEFSTPSMPGTTWKGVIDYVYPELDARTRTLRARIRVPNADGRLRPNMFVNLSMDAPIGNDLLTIPRPALIQRSDSQHVLLAEGNGYFRPVPVVTGREAGDRVVIREGLEVGQQVVVSAQFLIDSETSLEAAMLRLEADEQNHAGTIPDASPSALINATGRITELDSEASSITLEHAAIPELNWPAMTMAFGLADAVDTGALAPDQTVRFEFRESPEGYLIERIESAQDAQ